MVPRPPASAAVTVDDGFVCKQRFRMVRPVILRIPLDWTAVDIPLDMVTSQVNPTNEAAFSQTVSGDGYFVLPNRGRFFFRVS